MNNYAIEPEMYFNEPGDLQQPTEAAASERRHEMEEILEGFLMLYNHTLEVGRFVLAIARLSFLLGVSLLFLLLFGIVELQDKLPDLSLPTMVTLAVWVLITLLELVTDAWFFYKHLNTPWGRSTH